MNALFPLALAPLAVSLSSIPGEKTAPSAGSKGAGVLPGDAASKDSGLSSSKDSKDGGCVLNYVARVTGVDRCRFIFVREMGERRACACVCVRVRACACAIVCFSARVRASGGVGRVGVGWGRCASEVAANPHIFGRMLRLVCRRVVQTDRPTDRQTQNIHVSLLLTLTSDSRGSYIYI